jgi:phage tail protein X
VKPIKIVASDPKIEIEVPVGNLGAQLVAGLGGFEEVERQDDVSATDWVGQAALRQDISVLLDGYAKGDSVERELNTILKLGRDPNGERVPPVFRVWGPVYYEGKAWVLPPDGIDLTGGEIETIRRSGNGELLRQEVILHLLEFNPPDTIRIRGRHKPGGERGEPGRTGGTAFPGHSYTTKDGDTLHSIAARLYGDASEWKELGQKNGISDPNRKLPAGKVLKLP